MFIGYARVSTDDQDLRLQEDALRAAGVERLYRETASGGRWERPQLQGLLDHLRVGDVLVVWRLDRLSRSLRDLLLILERIDKAGASFRSLTEQAMDSTTPHGRMLMQLIGVFAEFERSILKARTKAGLAAARVRGRSGGRPSKLKAAQREHLVKLVRSGEKTAADAARLFGVHPATVGRILARAATANETSSEGRA